MRLSPAARVLLALWPVAAVAVGMILLESAWTAILLYHLGLAFALYRSGWRAPAASRGELRRGRAKATEIGLAIALGIAAFVSVRLILPLLAGEEAGALWDEIGQRIAHYGLQGASLAAFAVYFVTLHPLLEEAAWRGRPLGREERSLRWEDGAFALYHLPVLHCLFPGAWPLLAASAVALAGAAWFWRQRARSDRGLRNVVLQHACADAGILAAVLTG